MIAVWLRNAGDEDECWTPCAKGDPGATSFMPSSYLVHTNRLNDDLVNMNSGLVAEKHLLHRKLSEIHDITQDSNVSALDKVDNIAATAASALSFPHLCTPPSDRGQS